MLEATGAAKIDTDVKVAIRGNTDALFYAVATSGAKSVKICAGKQCIGLNKTIQRGEREIRYDDSTLAPSADGLMTAVVERQDGQTSVTSFRLKKT